jgi:carboxylate-amine ligase
MQDAFRAKFAFDPAKRFHLGAEEEVWTVHPVSGALVPGAVAAFSDEKEAALWPQCKPELPSQQIEAVTPVCATLADLDRALVRNQATLDAMAGKYGFALSRSPVPEKPFAVEVFPKPRYLDIKSRFGARLRGAYVAGLHVHLGVGSPEEAVRVMDFCRLHLPSFLALSARSPTCEGKKTGCESFRFIKYKEMAGDVVPPHLGSWDRFAAIAAEKGFADDPRMCWWAIRISPHGTVELRVCDVQQDREKTVGLAALFRLLAKMALDSPRPVPVVEDRIIDVALTRAAIGGFYDADHYLDLVRDADKTAYAEELPRVRRLLDLP